MGASITEHGSREKNVVLTKHLRSHWSLHCCDGELKLQLKQIIFIKTPRGVYFSWGGSNCLNIFNLKFSCENTFFFQFIFGYHCRGLSTVDFTKKKKQKNSIIYSWFLMSDCWKMCYNAIKCFFFWLKMYFYWNLLQKKYQMPFYSHTDTNFIFIICILVLSYKIA